MIKSNYLLTKEVLKELNAMHGFNKWEGFCLLANDTSDTIYIGFGEEIISKTTESELESVENVFEMLIEDFYVYNEKAQSKESCEAYNYYLNKLWKKMMKCDDESEILRFVKESKFINEMLEDLDDDLEFVNCMESLLFYGKELFEIALEENEI